MDFAFALFGGLVITGGVVLWDRLQRPKGTDFKDNVTIGSGSRVAGIVIEYALFPRDTGRICPSVIYRRAVQESLRFNAAESLYRRFYSRIKI